ncbi:hypothetical protein DASC09_004040 [Saccharomycopsis crataegensis]|uniref:Protein kinase domain-containing protein n=1 Tax=Saccharomycopsis crataegensis TaxID=43959 RepID=A0AAV5QEJ2_9ASCO|nr:hypothetical protein DASC09_004040 [Saccharomycopsis crataegensis]
MDFFGTKDELLDELEEKFGSMETDDQLCDEFWRSVATIVDIQKGNGSPSSWDSPLELKKFSCFENVIETFNGYIIHKTNFTVNDTDNRIIQNMVEDFYDSLSHCFRTEATRQKKKKQSELISESFGNLKGANALRRENIKRILNALRTKALLLINPPMLLQEAHFCSGKEKITESSSSQIRCSKGSKGSKKKVSKGSVFHNSTYRKNNIYKSLRYCFIEGRNDLNPMIETWIRELVGAIAQASSEYLLIPRKSSQLDNHSSEAEFTLSLLETTLKPTFFLISKMMEIKGLGEIGLVLQTRIDFSVREIDKVKHFTNIVDITVRSQHGKEFPIELKLPSLAQHLQRIKEGYFCTGEKTSKEFFTKMKHLANLSSQVVYQAISGHSIGGVLTDTQSFLLFCFDLSELQKNQELQGKLRKYEQSKDKQETERLACEIEIFIDNHLERVIRNHPFKTPDTINITQIDMKTLCLTNDAMSENDFSITLKLLVFIYKVIVMNIEHQTLIRFFYDRLLQKLLLSTREKLQIIKNGQKVIVLFYKFIFKEDQRAGKLFQTVCPDLEFLEKQKKDCSKACKVFHSKNSWRYEKCLKLKDLEVEEILSGEKIGQRLSTVLKVLNKDKSHSVIKLLDVHRIYDGSEESEECEDGFAIGYKVELTIDLFFNELLCYLLLSEKNVTPKLESFGVLENEKYESLKSTDLKSFAPLSTDQTYLCGLYIKLNLIKGNPPCSYNHYDVLLTFFVAMRKLVCMHQNKVFHGDIKRGNVKMISYWEYEKKIFDFFFLDFGISIAKINMNSEDGSNDSSDNLFFNKLVSNPEQNISSIVRNDINSTVQVFDLLTGKAKYSKKLIAGTLKSHVKNLDECIEAVSLEISKVGQLGPKRQKRQKKDCFSEESELAQKEEKRKTFTELKTLFSSILTILHPITAVSSFNDLADTVIRARLDFPSTDIRSHYCESIKKILNFS